MSDLDGNPEDRFSHIAAHLFLRYGKDAGEVTEDTLYSAGNIAMIYDSI